MSDSGWPLTRRSVLTALAALPLAGGARALGFRIHDATLYRGKPDLREFGVPPMPIVYAGELWAAGESRAGLPRRERVEARIARLPPAVGDAVIDIEHWPLRVSDAGDAGLAASIERYRTVLRWARAARPRLRLGLYGLLPLREYWGALDRAGGARRAAWDDDNRRLAPLADSVDALYPSLYTFYEDVEGWVAYARANIEAARAIANGRPVLAFVWPQFHDSNRALGHAFLPAAYWRVQLETLQRHADGVVIWGGWGRDGRLDWDAQAPWWRVTREFLAAQHGKGPA